MFTRRSSHFRAVLQALFVTFLWSTSWPLIKIGLKDIPALPFAGIRYALAAGCLLAITLGSERRATLKKLSPRMWIEIIGLGVLLYGVVPGSQFLGLTYLPAVTTSLLLSFTTIFVALMGIVFLKERPTYLQWGGTALCMIGVLVYFYPVLLPEGQTLGLVIVMIGVLANAVAAILGRHVNRDGQLDATVVTTISAIAGAVVLLVGGVAAQGWPQLTPTNWLMIIWLAVVNTAFAYTLWNYTLRALNAMESSIINNTMLFQIAVLAWLFLDEELTERQVLGMVLAAIGTLAVQMRNPLPRPLLRRKPQYHGDQEVIG